MFRVNETKCMFSSKEILRILDCKACEVKDFEITEVSVDSRQRQALFIPYRTLHFHLFTLQIFYRRSILSNNDCIFTDRVLQSIQRQHPIQSLLYSDLFHIQRNIGNLTDIVYPEDIGSGVAMG